MTSMTNKVKIMFFDDFALIHKNHAVRYVFCKVHFMRDDYHCHFFFCKFCNYF